MNKHAGRQVSPEGLASVLRDNGTPAPDWYKHYDAVPREAFVPVVFWPGRKSGIGQGHAIDRRKDPEAWYGAVYSDIPLTTQFDDGAHTGPEPGKSPTCSSSRPSMVFAMLDALDVRDGHRVLEIGTGTGWNAALLCDRLGSANVFTVEVDHDNHQRARGALCRAGYRPTTVMGDGSEGYLPGAPYDRVLITASVTEIPRDVIRQTRTGGVIVAPYATSYSGEAVARLTVREDGSASGPFLRSSAFMRLRQQRTSRKHTREYLGGKDWPADGIRSRTHLSPEEVGGWLPMFAIGLQTRGVFPWMESYKDESYTLWLRDEAVTSWATVDYVPDAEEFEVYQSGPRLLWDEVETAFRRWDRWGRPGFHQFGLTVGTGGRHTPWLDAPACPLTQVTRC